VVSSDAPGARVSHDSNCSLDAGARHSRVMPLTDWDHNAWYHRVLLQQVPAGAQRVLDVGCGAGTLARRLATVVPHVDGVDRSPEMVTEARRLAPVRRRAAAVLPGVRVRRLVLWRYLLTWRKPL
jgi:SAM-dependent methyltransferase